MSDKDFSKLPPRIKPEDLEHARLMCTQDKTSMHFSHLHSYVSAYETNKTTKRDLEIAIIEAFILLKERGHGSEKVDQDGEMQLEVCAGGQIRLMLPWKSFDAKIEIPFQDEPQSVQSLTKKDLENYLEVLKKRGQ